MNVSEVLNKAADEVERRGWTNGTGWNLAAEPDAPVCLEGGLQSVLGIHWDDSDILKALSLYRAPAYLAVRAHLGGRVPSQWNDHLPHGRILAAIAAHDYGNGGLDMETVRADAHAWATTEVIATLRACAIIEAARETDVTTVAPAPVAVS